MQQNDPGSAGVPAGANAQLANEIRAEIAQLKTEVRKELDSALASQEHRLLPAVTGLLHAVFRLRGEDRRRQVVAFGGAVFWCLIPSAGTASVGIVAIFSLLIAWQQARLLSAQNEKIEVQNILAEAQRRSSLIYETTALMALIEDEKKNAPSSEKGGNRCQDLNSFECWLFADSETPMFVPSRATLGRLAALTRALRPYRYLSVEDSRQYRFIGRETSEEVCTESFQSEALLASRRLIERAAYQVSPEDADLRSLDALRKRIAAVYGAATLPSTSGTGADAWSKKIERSMGVFLGASNETSGIRINCSPASPERGQLLISLHAAGVDISRVAAAGGDFRYADIPGAQLKNIRLSNVDLSYARLPNASFEKGHLERVKFEYAHLANVSFRDATLIAVSFDGAVIQSANDGAASANLFGPLAAADNVLDGLKFVEVDDGEDLIDRICTAGSMVGKLDRKTMRLRTEVRELAMMSELRRFALLVERRDSMATGGQGRLLATIVPKSLATRETLYTAGPGRPSLLVEYAPFDTCSNWPAAAKPLTQ